MATCLGLDAGGTGSRWVLLHEEGGVLLRGEGPAMQVTMLGVDGAARRLMAVLDEVVQRAGEPPAAAVAGLAGAGDPEIRAALERAVAAALPLRVTGDPEVAAGAALSEGPGVALWAGTGSFAVARAAGGTLHRVGGRGPLLSDEGGAYDLVRRAAVAAVRAADGLAPATSLGAALAERFEVARPELLGGRLPRLPAGEIAAALPVVRTCAAAGDGVAQGVLDTGVQALTELAGAAARAAALAPRTCTVALGGGVLARWPEHAARVESALRDAGFAAVAEAGDAAYGAAQLARAVYRGLEPLRSWVAGHGPAA